MQQIVTTSASINLTKRFDRNLYFILLLLLLLFEILNIALVWQAFSYLYRMTNSIIAGEKSDGGKKKTKSKIQI